MLKISSYIISWEGKHQSAAKIAMEVEPHVDELFVIYSNNADLPEEGAGSWIKVPNSFYFGKKFETAIRSFNSDIFLLIHADSDTTDWQSLVVRCRKVFSSKKLGVWAPTISYTPWTEAKTLILHHPEKDLDLVAQTDGIVVAYSAPVADRLRQLNYNTNNIGWGIDWTAICYAYSTGLTVARDRQIKVTHPKGTGYQHAQAFIQMENFLEQLTVQEKVQFRLLSHFTNHPLR